jgi:flavin reductase (DIM6/NTAB) family NADH-FMN oxidoreductase RutF
MPDTTSYELLRTLTSPVVAITTHLGDKSNGMISDAAIRASIVPDIPRLGVFIHKFNFSHDLVWESGRFTLHVLHPGQVDLVIGFGFRSGRDHDKLAGVPHRAGVTGCPILDDCYAWFECEVCNAMDTGSSTFFMGDVVAHGRGPGKEPLEPAALREALPAELMKDYAAKLEHAQEAARRASRNLRPVIWRTLGDNVAGKGMGGASRLTRSD